MKNSEKLKIPLITWYNWVENEIQISDKKIINNMLIQLNEKLKKEDPDQYDLGFRIYYNYDWRKLVGNIPPRQPWDRYLPDSYFYDPMFIDICFYITTIEKYENSIKINSFKK